MAMRVNVIKPTDSLLQLEEISINIPAGAKEFSVTGIGRIVSTPSSWLAKTGNLTRLHVCAAHPAWMHSGMDYDTKVMVMNTGYQHYASGTTVYGTSEIPNPKLTHKVTSMAHTIKPSSLEIMVADNIPIHYYGAPMEKKKPTDSGAFTFLTEIIDSDYIEVTCLSPYEYEITVKQDLVDDQRFYIPTANAKGLADTIWGEAGTDSTLPDGACAGLIKVRCEAMLDGRHGQYLVTGDDLLAIKRVSFRVYENQAVDLPVGAFPSWYVNRYSATLRATDQWKAINKLVQNDTEYFACGYQVGATTVGTGLFVKDNNVPCALAYGYTTTGVGYHRTFQQQSGSPVKAIKMREFLDCEGFFASLSELGLNAEPLGEGTLIPLCASSLEYISNKRPPTGFYRPPIDPEYNYAYPAFNIGDTDLTVEVTPLYIPIGAKQHCYVPPITNRASTMVSMIYLRNLDEDLALTLRPTTDWIFPSMSATAVPTKIKSNPSIRYSNPSYPTNGYDRDQIGFYVTGSDSTYTVRLSSTTTVQYSRCQATIDWVNPFADPTVGMDSSTDFYTNNAMISGMIMVFTGFLPAGTKAGTYLWKPFKTAERSPGFLSVQSCEFIQEDLSADIVNESMDAPYLGLNIVSAEGPNVEWTYPQKTDEAGDYQFYQVLKRIAISKTETTLIWDEIRIMLQQEVVPLVGYPIADKPMLIDIDDWSGTHVCDLEDLMMTAPFYDKSIDSWVVVAASGQTGRMYRLDVEVDDTHRFVTRFVTVRDSRELFDTPYGHFTEILGLAYTKDIYYTGETEPVLIPVMTDPTQAEPAITAGQSLTLDKGSPMTPYQIQGTRTTVGETFDVDVEYQSSDEETEAYNEDYHLVIYGLTTQDDSSKVKGSNLVIATCRTYMEWDVDKDTIARVRVSEQLPTDFVIDPDVVWPKSVAVMFPYIYILGYCWNTTPTNPLIKAGMSGATNITGAGWQMCLWKVDITSGLVNEVIPLTDGSDFRFSYGIPAIDKDANQMYRADKDSVGSAAMKYTWGSSNPRVRPTSSDLPKKSKSWEFPAISGLCCVAGQLMAFSNYLEQPVLINPMTSCVETTGLSIFPLTYPFNDNVAAAGDVIAALSKFGGKPFYTAHPFYQLCIGDGLPPNNFGMGIDVQDITTGHKLVRKCLVRNNSLRDRLEDVELIVPDPSVLKGSEMLYLSLTGDEVDMAKSIKFEEPIHASASLAFYLHVEPKGTNYDENLILYLNAKFARITEFFGYRM